jgi:methanol:N,N-dimethyl-4-nitrosoaniline oxidoreductase
VALYTENHCDSFVSIGGGSSHDACKGARVSVAHDGRNVNEFEGFNMSENPKNPPHIAVSTTAGTGSETSWAYVITDTSTDPDNPHKYVAFDDACVTTLAIDDPVLYYDCPVDYTAQCGFDVLAHASEPYVSRLNFQPSLGNALHAIRLTTENLRAAVWNGQDLPGREGMMYAQYIAAQAFNSGGLGIIHSISHAISAFYDTHHGLNNAVALPRVWAFNMPAAYGRFADIAEVMGIDTHGMTKPQAADASTSVTWPSGPTARNRLVWVASTQSCRAIIVQPERRWPAAARSTSSSSVRGSSWVRTSAAEIPSSACTADVSRALVRFSSA